MLEATSVAIVGASSRPDSFGARMVTEMARSSAPVVVHLVNPHYSEIFGQPCLPSLDDIEKPVDLVLLGVPDAALETELSRAAARGDGSAVIFGNAYEAPSGDRQPLRRRLAAIARQAGMALCGPGCMGFINVSHGLRAVGYVEPEVIPQGQVALVTHSGSVFSAFLRTRRKIGFTIAVSSGQEVVSTTADYINYALDQQATGIVGLVLETMHSVDALRASLERAAVTQVDVVALTVGSSSVGNALVSAHSGALAGTDAGWEALFDAYDVKRVSDLEELADTLELLTSGRRLAHEAGGLATVHDSGAERVLFADHAERIGVPFAAIADETKDQLAKIVDPGLEASNPLDLWGTGNATADLVGRCLEALASDRGVAAVVLCVDLVRENDGDDSYLRAALQAWTGMEKPFAVLSNMASALDGETAAALRGHGIPVLEGTRSGLVALKHLLAGPPRPKLPGTDSSVRDPGRLARALDLLAAAPRSEAPDGSSRGILSGGVALELIAGYGMATARCRLAADEVSAVAAAEALGYPVVLKTAAPGILHKTDARGVILGLWSAEAVSAAYRDLSGRLGSEVEISATAIPGVELSLGLVHDRHLGPLIVVGAGGTLVELIGDRRVALPPIDLAKAASMVDGLRVRPLLDGLHGALPADIRAVAQAVTALATLAMEIGDHIEELDINPLICGPDGAVAVDALLISRAP